MAKAKTPNYTEKQTNAIVEAYNAVLDADQETRDAVVDQLAAEFGRKRRSIIAKLAKETSYVTKEKKSTVTGRPAQKKEAMADSLREASGMKLAGIENSNKTAIAELLSFFESEQEPETDPEDNTEV